MLMKVFGLKFEVRTALKSVVLRIIMPMVKYMYICTNNKIELPSFLSFGQPVLVTVLNDFIKTFLFNWLI